MVRTVEIDLGNFEGPIYSGRKRGEAAREDVGIDRLDEQNVVVNVRIPDSAYTVTSSFFLGMFGPSILRMGSKNAFKQKFQIKADSAIGDLVDSYIDTALETKALFAR